jgi:hypothetical protein
MFLLLQKGQKRKNNFMSEEKDQVFSGFMPMISYVNVSESTTMLSTEGELVRAHTVNIVTKTGDNYVFSMDQVDLMRLAFLLIKVASDQ